VPSGLKRASASLRNAPGRATHDGAISLSEQKQITSTCFTPRPSILPRHRRPPPLHPRTPDVLPTSPCHQLLRNVASRHDTTSGTRDKACCVCDLARAAGVCTVC
jgi:hypothetical protein